MFWCISSFFTRVMWFSFVKLKISVTNESRFLSWEIIIIWAVLSRSKISCILLICSWLNPSVGSLRFNQRLFSTRGNKRELRNRFILSRALKYNPSIKSWFIFSNFLLITSVIRMNFGIIWSWIKRRMISLKYFFKKPLKYFLKIKHF